MLALVVDDDVAVRSFIESILHAERFETLEAGDGEHALEIVRMIDGEVDLIISDIQMPGGDGISLARAVRRVYPFVPVILVSGHGDPATEFEFIAKPFSWTAMSRAIHRVVCRAA